MSLKYPLVLHISTAQHFISWGEWCYCEPSSSRQSFGGGFLGLEEGAAVPFHGVGRGMGRHKKWHNFLCEADNPTSMAFCHHLVWFLAFSYMGWGELKSAEHVCCSYTKLLAMRLDILHRLWTNPNLFSFQSFSNNLRHLKSSIQLVLCFYPYKYKLLHFSNYSILCIWQYFAWKILNFDFNHKTFPSQISLKCYILYLFHGKWKLLQSIIEKNTCLVLFI